MAAGWRDLFALVLGWKSSDEFQPSADTVIRRRPTVADSTIRRRPSQASSTIRRRSSVASSTIRRPR